MGGAERLQVTLANKLAEAGYDVTILIWTPLYTFRENLDPRVRLIYKAPDEHLGNRIPYIRHKFYDGCMWELRATPKQLYRYYVGREKYDVEIAFFHGLALRIVAGSTDKKAFHLAWVHHDLEKLAYKDDAERSKKMYRTIRNIVCVSRASYDSFMKTVGDTGSVRLIYNLLPTGEIRRLAEEPPVHRIKKAKFHIVITARFDPNKGQDRLIDAVARLRHEGKDVSLALIGEGDDEKRLRERILEAGMQDCITIADGGNNPYPYIKEADVLACASISEGYNLTVAEALMLGVPVLSTDCAGPREILDGGRYGMLVENSGEGVYRGLKELYESPSLLAVYKKKAVERQDFFNEDKIFKQITDLIEG
jgi:glycosyltransferase involved in cell wall biosynthesis